MKRRAAFSTKWRHAVSFSLALMGAAGMIALFPGIAHAYLDPGTGSMLLSAFIGIAVTLFFMVKTFYYKTAGLFYRLTGSAMPVNNKNGIVFYSEGGHYWDTFKPVLEALDHMGVEAMYLTSGKNDPGLDHPFTKHVTARHIGTGNRAFAAMNMLEAGVCIMTTPGLDVLQIRRSPGVAHYAYLMHSVTDVAIYKLYSFDYYDSVLCSGPHQIKSLQHLEEIRGTKQKKLLHTGCPYMDALADELDTTSNAPTTPPGKLRVLVAPTWGANGLLRRFGIDLLLPMADTGFELTIRPHPQSRIQEFDLLEQLKTALSPYPNVLWDHAASPLNAMLNSDVLLSDLSGIVFDYAFILERPVVTVAMETDVRGLEAGDLPYVPWELTKLAELGASINPEDIRNLPEVVASLPPATAFSERMRKLRSESLYNYRASGRKAAEHIVALQQTLLKDADKR